MAVAGTGVDVVRVVAKQPALLLTDSWALDIPMDQPQGTNLPANSSPSSVIGPAVNTHSTGAGQSDGTSDAQVDGQQPTASLGCERSSSRDISHHHMDSSWYTMHSDLGAPNLQANIPLQPHRPMSTTSSPELRQTQPVSSTSSSASTAAAADEASSKWDSQTLDPLIDPNNVPTTSFTTATPPFFTLWSTRQQKQQQQQKQKQKQQQQMMETEPRAAAHGTSISSAAEPPAAASNGSHLTQPAPAAAAAAPPVMPHQPVTAEVEDGSDMLRAWEFGLSSDGQPEWGAQLAELRKYVQRYGDAGAGFRSGDHGELSRW